MAAWCIASGEAAWGQSPAMSAKDMDGEVNAHLVEQRSVSLHLDLGLDPPAVTGRLRALPVRDSRESTMTTRASPRSEACAELGRDRRTHLPDQAP